MEYEVNIIRKWGQVGWYFGAYYQSIGDNTLADAILDRLMHNAHQIKLKGESIRKMQSKID